MESKRIKINLYCYRNTLILQIMYRLFTAAVDRVAKYPEGTKQQQGHVPKNLPPGTQKEI